MDTKELKQKARRLRALALEAERAAGIRAVAVQDRVVDSGREIASIRRAASQDVTTEYGTLIERGPKDAKRREAAELSLEQFCKSYGPKAFCLNWSTSHLQAIELIERAVRSGELFAFAMPRGSGKTTLSRWGILWAIMCGHSPYAVLIGPTMANSERQLKNIKTELRFNDNLLADFPEVCAPVRHLRGESRRASGQKYNGSPTLIEWNKNQIILASIDSVPGAIVDVTGIEGEIRGRQYTRSDGSVVRPTLAICDDPQTRESARSMSQSEYRESILSGDIKYLAGPDRPLGVVMPCTVIAQGDMADRMLDRNMHKEWNGQKTKMVISFPSNEKLWEEYARIRSESFLNGGQGREATAFYRSNREAMDKGAEVSWPERYFPDEESAIQHAMNLRLLDEAAFYAEYQNEPIGGQSDDIHGATPEEIAAKVVSVRRGIVPADCTKVTAMVDISQKVLWWMVCAWRQNFTGHIVDCGVYPSQNRQYTTLASAKITLQHKSPGQTFEAALNAGLSALATGVLSREYRSETGTIMRPDLCLIDANWGQSTNVVTQFCRRSPIASILRPSHGVGITASRKPINDLETRPKPGEIRGVHWRILPSRDRGLRVHYDTNYWKSQIDNRWQVPVGDGGCLTLFQGDEAVHRMLIEQLTAEYCVRTEGRGRTVDEWQLRTGRDNHFLDCLVGAAVGASVLGITTGEQAEFQPKQPKKVSKADWEAKKRARQLARERRALRV